MTRPALQILTDADTRLRASIMREVVFARAMPHVERTYGLGRIRTLSRQRMEIQHAIRLLRNPARALEALRAV